MSDDPPKIHKRPRKYAKLTGLPARIRLDAEPRREGSALVLDFAIEPYDVPEEGGDVLSFGAPRDITKS